MDTQHLALHLYYTWYSYCDVIQPKHDCNTTVCTCVLSLMHSWINSGLSTVSYQLYYSLTQWYGIWPAAVRHTHARSLCKIYSASQSSSKNPPMHDYAATNWMARAKLHTLVPDYNNTKTAGTLAFRVMQSVFTPAFQYPLWLTGRPYRLGFPAMREV